MAVGNVNYSCPACGGPLTFSTKLQKLNCEYCDSSFTTEEVEAYFAEKQAKAEAKEAAKKAAEDAAAAAAGGEVAAEVGEEGAAVAAAEADAAVDEAAQRIADANADDRPPAAAAAAAGAAAVDPIQAYLDSKRPLEEGDDNTTAVECSSCGATMIVSDVSAVTQCPYCGNNAIVPGKLGGTLEPDYVIPFAIDKKTAIAKLKDHYRGKICLPKVFSDENHIEEIQGVYVPFWLFDGKTDGCADFNCTNVRVFTDGDYEVTETDTYHVHREGYCNFERVPADASKRMPDEHMDSIEPFNYDDMVPFSTAYLPGFAAERYDEEVSDCVARAKTRMDNSLVEGLEQHVSGYDSVMRTDHDTQETIEKVNYVLLPVWMLHTRWNDQDFLFAANGQTGKLVGDLPLDKKKLNLLTGAALAVGAVVGALLGTFIFA